MPSRTFKLAPGRPHPGAPGINPERLPLSSRTDKFAKVDGRGWEMQVICGHKTGLRKKKWFKTCHLKNNSEREYIHRGETELLGALETDYTIPMPPRPTGY